MQSLKTNFPSNTSALCSTEVLGRIYKIEMRKAYSCYNTLMEGTRRSRRHEKINRRDFLIRTGATVAGIGALSGYLILEQSKDERPLKEKILSFTWQDAENKDRLKSFVEILADEYLRLTGTTRIKKEDLISEGKLNFCLNRDQFIKEVKKVEPDYDPPSSKWGYAHYNTGKVFIDIGSLKKQNLTQTTSAGLPLIDALWHEWGHLDITESMSGELINHPEIARFYSPVSKKEEPYKKYRGAAVYTDTYYGFLRFEEVLNETIIVRRLIEQVGLNEIISAKDYFQNGIEFFPALTNALNIPLKTLYSMHATSDFEGLAKLIGNSLRGTDTPLTKGRILFAGIHNSDPNLIRQTGALDRIQPAQK